MTTFGLQNIFSQARIPIEQFCYSDRHLAFERIA